MHVLAATAPASNGISGVVALVFWIVGIALYWTPSIVAGLRKPKPPNIGSIIVLNFFLGWTVVGWIIALMMAVRSRPQQQYVMPPQGWQPPPQGWQPPPQQPYGTPGPQVPQQPGWQPPTGQQGFPPGQEPWRTS